uniref:Uncharacterized protein n=1 Tax=viral metagenome TaxID=1070528 RepID=A0A6C0CFV9_9ZZZZ
MEADNPFASFANRGGSEVYLPDADYLPEMYEYLGVDNFDQTGLIAPDYLSSWIGVRNEGWTTDDDGNEYIEFTGEDGVIKVVERFEPDDREMIIYYLERLPKLVLKRLAQKMENKKNAGAGAMPLSKISRDLFHRISSPDLKGKTLIGLCIQNAEINRYCNQDDQRLFRQRLLSEFDLDWTNDRRGFATPRELYVQLYTAYYVISEDDYGFYRDRVSRPINWEPIVRIVPRPNWRGLTYFFFFPEEPEISFLVSQQDDGSLVEERTRAVRELAGPERFDELINETINSGDTIGPEDTAIFRIGNVNQSLDWYVSNFDIPGDQNVLYVWLLE